MCTSNVFCWTFVIINIIIWMHFVWITNYKCFILCIVLHKLTLNLCLHTFKRNNAVTQTTPHFDHVFIAMLLSQIHFWILTFFPKGPKFHHRAHVYAKKATLLCKKQCVICNDALYQNTSYLIPMNFTFFG